MTPVLIYTDSNSIANQEATLTNIIPVYQAIYDAVQAAGITSPTLAEIDSLVQNARNQSTKDFVNQYVLNKLVAAVTPFVVNGVTLTSAAVAGMIAMPDTSAIKAALQPVWGNNAQSVFINTGGARIDLLSLTSNVISAVSNANTQIAALYTYYTTNNSSATLAPQLQAVCDALNTFNAANGGIYTKTIPTSKRNAQGDLESEIPGLAVSGVNSNYIISLWWIRRFEQLGTVNFSL